MTVAERISLLAEIFPSDGSFGFRSERDFFDFLAAELGDPGALDRFVPYPGGLRRAVAPESIYHLCASTLAISAQTSLLLGLLLDSRLFFKLPSTGLPDFVERVEGLPPEFRGRVVFSEEHDERTLQAAGAVVVFGSDETVAHFRERVPWHKPFLAYGHKISVGLIPPGAGSDPHWAAQAVREISAYDQLGCLSPQVYFCLDPREMEVFAGNVAAAFRRERPSRPVDELSFGVQAGIYQARQDARVLGCRLITPGEGLDWTVVCNEGELWNLGPGHRFIQIMSGFHLEAALTPWTGHLSALSAAVRDLRAFDSSPYLRYGFSRVCQTGDLQLPKLFWLHDGAPRLLPLLRWIYQEISGEHALEST